MLALLFSANYPGPQAPFWQYFGASLDHSVLALCFVTFLIGDSTEVASLNRSWMRKWHSASSRN
jgi:thiosulfate dehydrogenase [quinone] large subunit